MASNAMFIGITKKMISWLIAIKKSRRCGTLYMDGLVSTGIIHSQHNIKTVYYYNKKMQQKFYAHKKIKCE